MVGQLMLTDPIPLQAFQDNYIWVMTNRRSNTMICVDPGDATPVLSYALAHHLTISQVLITHHHADHTAGLPELLAHYPECQVWGPDDPRIRALCGSIHSTETRFSIEGHTFDVLPIPGHTRSHIAYLESKKGWLFCGDTLFSAGCGRVFDGTIEELYHSIQRIKRLPNQTYI